MLKLSMFKAVRKFNIFQGKMEQVEDLLHGEIVEFYNLGVSEIEAIQKSINKEDKYSDELHFLELVKNLTNIEADIDVTELNSMFKRPSKIFAELYKQIFKHVAYLVESAKNINDASIEIENTLESMGITKEMIEQTQKLEEVKSKKEKLEEVIKELETCEDLGKYKELQALKYELEVELNE